MHRSLLDRWTDTTVFRAALLFSGMAVLPVLALGAFVTVIGGAAVLMQQLSIELEQALFGLVSIGGALGFFGYARAHFAARNPVRHNLTLTLLCLAAGVAAALAVAAYVASATLEGLRSPWGSREWLLLGTPFAAANVVWAVSGIAWMQRLPRRYAEETSRAFDTLPVMLLVVAIALSTAALLTTTTL